ncbi:hypothetical protein SDC9_183669 [bioreactor metagenome]|uniref:Uncharacterized protein n=1 Tax=bioreactor metagenome TaxID=1076179 RepID=A0A645HCR8_9ZZZZ
MRSLRRLPLEPAESRRTARLQKQAFQHVGERFCVDVAHEFAIPCDGDCARLLRDDDGYAVRNGGDAERSAMPRTKLA